jgi:hypothetical protein
VDDDDKDETAWWTCPKCEGSWQHETDQYVPAQEAKFCFLCGEEPCELRPGEIVGVEDVVPYYGVVGFPDQMMVINPEWGPESRCRENGPYTGRYDICFIGTGRHQIEPPTGDMVEEIRSLDPDPERRARYANEEWTSTPLLPNEVIRLTTEEHKKLFPDLRNCKP